MIPIAQPKFTKTSMPDNPLLKVPPASRGNRWAWFPSRSGGNLKEGGNCKLRPRDWYYTGGKHQYMVRGEVRVVLPNPHQGDISRDLLARILRQAGISREEWVEL